MTTDANLPAHLDEIGRQLVASAHARKRETVHHRPQRARILLALVPTAAAAAVVMIVLNNVGPSRIGRLTPLAHPTARQVLDRAAFVSLQTTTVTPEPDQFIYTKTQTGGQIAQSWLSVDGKRTSMIDQPGHTTPYQIPGCPTGQSSSRLPGEDGKPIQDFLPASMRRKAVPLSQAGRYFPGGHVPMDGPVVTTKCTPQVAFYPEMPTDPSAMQAYLLKTHQEYPTTASYGIADVLNDLAKNVGYMLDSDYLLPAQQAALYRFLATTPGITVKQPVEDVAGRAGIGVGWNFEGSSSMLIFDASTYQYLGMTTFGEQGQVGGDALLQTAIVDTAGQAPTSTQATNTQPTSTQPTSTQLTSTQPSTTSQSSTSTATST